MRFSVLAWAFVIGTVGVVGCGKSADDKTTPGILSTGSCTVGESLCTELYTAASIEQYKTSCSESGGTYSATSPCKTQGKVIGCEFSIQSVKSHTLWYYDEAATAVVNSTCANLVSNMPGAASKVVTP